MSMLLAEVFRRSIFKLILAAYFLLELLPNDVTRWTAVTAFASDEESKEFINGKVLRVLIFNVLLIRILNFVTLFCRFIHNLL